MAPLGRLREPVGSSGPVAALRHVGREWRRSGDSASRSVHPARWRWETSARDGAARQTARAGRLMPPSDPRPAGVPSEPQPARRPIGVVGCQSSPDRTLDTAAGRDPSGFLVSLVAPRRARRGHRWAHPCTASCSRRCPAATVDHANTLTAEGRGHSTEHPFPSQPGCYGNPWIVGPHTRDGPRFVASSPLARREVDPAKRQKPRAG
jgi:hypothetical protein